MSIADARLAAAVRSLDCLPASRKDELAAAVQSGHSPLEDPSQCPYTDSGEPLPPRVREALLVALGRQPFARHIVRAS